MTNYDSASGLDVKTSEAPNELTLNAPLRIHYFTSFVHEQGTYFRFHNLAKELAELGHQVTVFACDLDTKAKRRIEVRNNVTYDIMVQSLKPSIFSNSCHPITSLKRSLRRYPQSDVAHLFQPFLSSFAGWKFCSSKVKFYDWDDLWTNGLTTGPFRSWREYWPRTITSILESTLPRSADHVTVASSFLSNLATTRGAKNVSVVHNGFTPYSYPDTVEAREKLNLKRDAVYMGFMGRTVAELSWCFDALDEASNSVPNLRFAVCGPSRDILDDLSTETKERVDYLGQLSPDQSRTFAAAIDLGLLPMEDSPFNRSRYPIKFCEHLATGKPLLFSEVGEVNRLAKHFDWAFPAGKTREEWITALIHCVNRLANTKHAKAEVPLLEQMLSWRNIAIQMESLYRQSVHNVVDTKSKF